MSNYPMTFHKSTKFVTDQGVRSFFDFNPGDTVNVYNRYGELEEGTIVNINHYDSNYTINTFNIGGDESNKPNGQLPSDKFLTKKEIITHGGDLWLSYNGDYYEYLKFGDAIAVAPKNINNIFIDLKSPEWFINGIIFAVGKDYLQYYSSDNVNVNLRKLAEGNYFVMTEEEYNKNKILLNGLNLYGQKYKNFKTYIPIKAYPEDYIIFMRGPRKRTTLLSINAWIKCPDYYKGDAFEGYLYFKDKDILNDGRIIITESDDKVVKFIEDCSKFAGYHITNIKEIAKPTSIQTPLYNGSDHEHDEYDVVIGKVNLYKKQVRYWEIILDPKYKRTNQRKYKFISKENRHFNSDNGSFIVDTESGSFILANGVIVLSKPYDYIVR